MKTIVFVHGLGGWGVNENFIDYWNDSILLKYFPPNEYRFHIASVGAISSNWDRACELYAQIKGGQVDYGHVHSKKFNHARWGETFDGFYPEWDEKNPITLIGHSMGGQTIRMLEKLLQVGDVEERNCTVREDVKAESPLFRGLGRWIENVVTISTPHKGSQLFDTFGSYLVDKIKDTVIKSALKLNKHKPIKNFYDFDIDHFGLNIHKNESSEEYKKRINQHEVFQTDYKDISSWDLSPQGSEEFNNSSASCYKKTRYLAISTYSTFKLPFVGIYVPSPFTTTVLKIPSGLMSFSDHNDGLVTRDSSRGPVISPIRYLYGQQVEDEKWYYHDLNLDHFQVLGTFGLYMDHVDECYQVIKQFVEK